MTDQLRLAHDLLSAACEADAALRENDTSRFDACHQRLGGFPDSALACALRTALEAQDAARHGQLDSARDGFLTLLASPFSLPGALEAAQRFFGGQAYLEAALACLGRRLAPLQPADATTAGLQQSLGARYWELWRPALQASDFSIDLLYFLKLDMQARHEIKDAIAAYALMLAPGGAAHLNFLKVEPLLGYARANGFHVTETVPAGIKQVSSSVVVGQPRLPPYEVEGRAVFHAMLRDATITAGSSGIEIDGRLLFDYQGGDLERISVDFRYDAPIVAMEDGTAAVVGLAEGTDEIDRAINLVGATSSAFGHWMLEYLPKFFGMALAGIPEDVPVVIDAAMPPTHRQALDYFSQGRRPIITLAPRRRLRVRELWVASTFCYVPVLPRPGQDFTPEAFNFDSRALAALIDRFDLPAPDPRAPRKIYLGRRAHLARKLLNVEAVEALCGARGFETIYLEDLSFPEQLATIRSATHIIAPAGSALLLPFGYGTAGTRILNLHPPYIDETPGLTDIAHARGIEVSVILGTSERLEESYRGRSDFAVPLDPLRAVLDAWERGA
ncbi:glycosyltransferase family 61 protein [Ancylobacter pratisalsi]|uniref:Glycosyltransferase family 61 protein n=1 Tax=Ancylobacter pratisalsi TaxID=1745854 RepID=A0A6P1YJ36_9HYPH|nr:glycosyltransferase family 61 protein [Ancylobacter pratisalsi]QIB32706.1 glycosyltransferase family 61 protein [Ancylobacter pratisalsi]